MEELLLLSAACLCFCCSIISFLPACNKKINRIKLFLWCLSSGLVACAAARLIALQIMSKFEYLYVYNHTSLNTAQIYKISALWSGQEGSFLLWALFLCLLGFFVLFIKGKGAEKSFGIYASISFCIILMCLISQPFVKTAAVPADGLGLNEALQNPWMVVHPPLVFISYSAMAVLFSLSTTVSKGINKAVSDRILIWLRISWFFLGAGIFTGSIWAYRALGWGGYWSWDPIENTALVPWLVLCGFLHRKNYSNLTVCMVPFPIACFGVFLARSGILKDRSSHAYTEGNIIITGITICLIIISALFLAFYKSRNVKNDKQYTELKKDKLKHFLTLSFNAYAALIFAGTVAPIVLRIETPVLYYTVISISFALACSILLLIQDLTLLMKRNIVMMVIGTVLILAVILLAGSKSLWWLFFLWVCLMPLSLWLAGGFKTKGWKYYISHTGLVLLIAGAVCSSALGKETCVIANPGGSIVIEGAEIPDEFLYRQEVLIRTLPTKDLIINNAKILPMENGGAFIPYTTKPLIILFWAGGCTVIAVPCILIISGMITKHKDRKNRYRGIV